MIDCEVNMSSFKFTPNRLIQARDEIIQIHSKTNITKFSYNNKEREVIQKVLGWKKEQIKVKYLTLTTDELIIIASYLPYNYDGINMENLMEVISRAYTSLLGDILIFQWHYSYKNKECNIYMASLLEINSEFKQSLGKYEYDLNRFLKVLKSPNTLVEFGKMLLHYSNGNTVEEKLKLHNIGVNTRIYADCLQYFYIYCRSRDYFNNYSQLLNIIRGYDASNRKMFLINFVNEISFVELTKCNDIANFCSAYLTGEIDTSKYIRYFEDVPKETEMKYRNWINSYNIEKFFGTDERSVFWRKYRFISVQKDYQHGMISMECDNYYITEFLGKGMGAMYIYDKEVYRNTVKMWMRYYTTTELKSKMYQNVEVAVRRFVHLPQPGWQYDFRNYIIWNKITDTLY